MLLRGKRRIVVDARPVIGLTAPAPTPDPMLDNMVNFGSRMPDGDTDRYSAWAERLRDKRARNQASILGAPVNGNDSVGYWSSESVLSGDDPVDDPGIVPDQMRKGRLLLELGLSDGATADQASAAYRGLAKVHHPDRWVEADAATRAEHAEEMLRVNAVYQALRRELTA